MPRIQERFEIASPAMAVYDALSQPETIIGTLPGVSSIYRFDPTHYRVQIGSAGRAYQLDIEVTERDPARRLAWRHVIIGALVTALLFHLGRWGIGLYLGRATQPTAYGAAASFAALLLWLYYSAQIFLFGAEFTACLGQSRTPKPLASAGAKA